MAFAGFVSERGPPYRACDLFDEVLSGMATVTRLNVLQLQYDLTTFFIISLLYATGLVERLYHLGTA
jgi:hypothetical protein